MSSIGTKLIETSGMWTKLIVHQIFNEHVNLRGINLSP